MMQTRLFVSRRMTAVQSPVIPVVGELIRRHPGTLSLGQGVAYWGPPAAARESVNAFFDQPEHHKYGPVQGILPLLERIQRKLAEDGVFCGDSRRIVVTAGANMGFLNALFAIADPDDEVILPSPYYFNQEMAVRMLGCHPVLVPTDPQFQICVDRLRAAITDRTRAIVTISPNNPSGAVYPEQSLREINALCRERGIYHISDEAYEYFLYEGARHFSPAAISGGEDHTLALYSLSKAYGFASWRIGYMVIPAHLYDAVRKAQDTNLICPPLISQFAALGALEAGPSYCREKLRLTAAVRDLVLQGLEAVSDICFWVPGKGAFYLLVKVATELDAMTVTERLIREHRIAVVPGTTFGLENGCYLRIAYGALDRDTAAEAVRRLVHGLRCIVAAPEGRCAPPG